MDQLGWALGLGNNGSLVLFSTQTKKNEVRDTSPITSETFLAAPLLAWVRVWGTLKIRRVAGLVHVKSVEAQCPPWLEHRTPDRKAWIRCPMPPNTLRVHTEYVLAKSVGPKSCEMSHECRNWRIFPFPPVPCLNCGDGDRW
ncbi:hypothetical protein TNCV_1643421 [Trichonephila clavipes]|nr:hypothetical protein TNCV_1643421 [Trichonephila clavipes]